MRYFAFILFIFSTLALADVTVPSSATDIYSHQDFNRASIYKLRNLYLGDSSDYTLQLKAPDTLTDDDTVFQLPGDNGTANYYLNTDGSGVTNWNELDVSHDSNAATTLGLSATDDVEHQSLDISGTAGAGFLELKHQSSAPASPAGADDLRIFVDSKKVYTKDSAGITTEVGSGASSGGGGINILAIGDANWDFESGDTKWTESGTSTFTADDTTADVFLGTYSGLWDAGASGEYLTGTAVTIPNALTGGTLCLLEFYYKGGDANIDFYAYDGTSAVANSTDTLAASTEWIRAYSTFTCPSSGTITLRLESSADSAAIYIDNVKIGTTEGPVTVPDNRWPSYDESDVTIETDLATETIDYAKITLEQDTDDNWYMSFTVDLTHTAATAAFNVSFTGVTFAGASTSDLLAVAWSAGSGSISGVADAVGTTNYVRIRGDGTSHTVSSITGSKIPLASKPNFATKPSPDMYISGGVSTTEVGLSLAEDNPSIDGGSITTSWNDIIYPSPTTNEDTHSGYNTSTGGYTVPYNGWYNLSGLILVGDTGTATANEYAGLAFEINGAIVNQILEYSGGGESYLPVALSATYKLNAGDIVKWQTRSNLTGAALSSSSIYNHKSVIKIPTPQEVANMIVGFNEAKDGRAGLIDYYNTTSVSVDNDFTGGTLHITRIGNQVTITATGLTHAADSNPITTAIIPEWARPTASITNVNGVGSGGTDRLTVGSTGTFQTIYFNTSFVQDTSRTSADELSISYIKY